ncbi:MULTISPECIES: DUF938 domain-containing protein [unclassified Pseudoalteromonas]|uniref:DUF938 domain-containing protein n=1 Tax=unclassified Pseudoalteromonas TaxID=194690 RepID=UPI0030146413
MTKPFSQACENNKDPILEKLKPHLTGRLQLLEIGSGTGQHAVHFAQHLPELTWQTADQQMHHEGINAWLAEAQLSNLRPPLAIDLHFSWPVKQQYDAIFTANTVHIISEQLVVKLIQGAAMHLKPAGLLFIYGPFNYHGQYTSASNERFDALLQQRDPQSGIREQTWLVSLAQQHGFTLLEDHQMPANNRLLLFKR